MYGRLTLVGTVLVHLCTAATTCTLKPNVDPTRCGIVGTVLPDDMRHYGRFAISQVPSKEDCADLCARRINRDQKSMPRYMELPYLCNAFFFDIQNSVCQLLSANLPYVRANASHSSKHFYQADCFECGDQDPCKQPYNAQLVDNGGFDDSNFGPWTVDYSRRGTGRKSKYAYECAGDSRKGSYSACDLGQRVNTCQGGLYMTRFDYISSGGYSLNQFEGSSLEVSNFTSADLGKWRTAWLFRRNVLDRVDDPTASLLEFSFQDIQGLTDGRSLKIDNVYLSRITESPQTVPGASNLIKNPGFESGKIEPWSRGSRSTKVVAPGLNKSKYALSINGTISQTISTIPGKGYLFRFEFTKHPNNEEVFSEFKFYNHHEQLSYQFDLAHQIPRDPTPFVATEEQTTISVQIVSQSSILVDNFSVKEIDISGF